MSFAIDVEALRERASRRCNPATVATLRPDNGSKVATVARSQVRVSTSGNPLMTAEQGDDCHAGGWSDAEIASFTVRRDRLLRWGYSIQEADNLAERLTLRDRDADGRHACAECRHGNGARCPDGAPMPGSRLHRCPVYSP